MSDCINVSLLKTLYTILSSEQLNSIFTTAELLDAISKLKNCYSEGVDRISNEMIKNHRLHATLDKQRRNEKSLGTVKLGR